jgi:hypothetical protein
VSRDAEGSDLTAAQAIELIDRFLENISDELAADDWQPSAEQVAQLHSQLGAVYHEWLISTGRHP